jgi:metal-responsive CopG/Arc/MetJ family transcriptional regulator
MAIKKLVSINFDPETLELLDSFVEKCRAQGQETSRSQIVRKLLRAAIAMENARS